MANCTGCNSCQSCNTGCQVCNSCQSLKCNTEQSLCTINCQVANQYGSNPWNGLCFEKDQFVTYNNLTASKIQAAYDWISSVLAQGSLVNTANWSGSLSNTTDLAAQETVTLQSGLSLLGVSISTKQPNDIIYGSYFDDIRNKMNGSGAQISSLACDSCNTKCQATCNVCNTCETCQNCDSITYCGEYCGQYCGEYCGEYCGQYCGQTTKPR